MPKATLTFAMRLFRVALPLAVLCLIALTRVALTWRVYTPTFDEPAHIAAGMEWLDRGAYRYEEMHPPLARVADALGPWVAGLHSEGQAGIRREGNAILNQRGDQARALALARAGALPFLLLAILVVFAWARSLAGDAAGLLAVLAFTSVPPVLAHAGLATTDAAAMGTIALAVYSMLRWLERPGLHATLRLGLAVGLALLAKMSAVVFLPAAFVVALLAWRTAGNPLASHLGGALVAGVVALLVIWAGYRFSIGPINERATTPGVAASPAQAGPGSLKGRVAAIFRMPIFPAPEYVRGIREIRGKNRIGERRNYLLGEP
ncbi:MAG TPA: glycosyltransferase family 39 protein, partial [Gemmatimonadales bacterium]